MALLWCEAVYIFCSHLFIHTVTDALQSCNLCGCSVTVGLVHSLKLKMGRKGGGKGPNVGNPLIFEIYDTFTCAVGLWLPQINPCFINSHEPDMWKWKTVASCDEVRWQNFICGQFWQYDGILKCQPFFLGQEYLSCSNCHINWFCLTELDRHHIQNVNSSLWLRCIQVWRPITVSRFVPLKIFFTNNNWYTFGEY